MMNLVMTRLGSTKLRILTGMLISSVVASAIYAQARRQLKVEIGTNQEIRIVASDVSYGDVLRALQGKVGWEIEIPALADQLKISDIRVEAQRPQDALAKLLEGSRLDYAFLGGANDSRILKVVVLPSTDGEVGVRQDTASSAPPISDDVAEASLPLPSQAQAATKSDRPEKSATMSLSDAISAIGAPPDVPPADVGRRTTFPISDAAQIMGVPPGLSPADVGRTMKMPISDAARIMGVPAGTSPGDIGKTITLPLPSSPGGRP